jgi:hypothetical protein
VLTLIGLKFGRFIVTKSKAEAICAEWFLEQLDPNDHKGLAALHKWIEDFGKRERRMVTIRDVLKGWEAILEREKLH